MKCSNRRWRRWCAAASLGLAAPAMAHDDDSQVWLNTTVQKRIDAANSFSVETSHRWREAGVGGNLMLVRGTWSHRVAKALTLSLGVATQHNAGKGEIRTEQAATFDIGPLALRNKLEQRMIDGAADTQWRLRERALLTLPLDRAWALIASGEAFFQLNRTGKSDVTGLNAVRTQLGLRRRVDRTWSVTLLYLRQQTVRPGRADSVSHAPVLGLAASF